MIYYSTVKTPFEHYSIYQKRFHGFMELHRQDGSTYDNRLRYYVQGNIFSRLSSLKNNSREMLKK